MSYCLCCRLSILVYRVAVFVEWFIVDQFCAVDWAPAEQPLIITSRGFPFKLWIYLFTQINGHRWSRLPQLPLTPYSAKNYCFCVKPKILKRYETDTKNVFSVDLLNIRPRSIFVPSYNDIFYYNLFRKSKPGQNTLSLDFYSPFVVPRYLCWNNYLKHQEPNRYILHQKNL